MKMKISEIELDEDIYPRQKVDHETVNSYVEALKASANFPPVMVQRIRIAPEKEGDQPKVKNISLDGWHRILAHVKYNELKNVTPIEEIEVVHWKEKILDKAENLEELRIQATLLNALHGNRMSKDDLEYQIQRIAQYNPNITQNNLAKTFDRILHRTTIGRWIKKIRQTQEFALRSFILRQHMLGHSFTKTSDQLKTIPLKNINRAQVNRIYNDDFEKLLEIIKNDYEAGKTIPEIINYKDIASIDPYSEEYDEALGWALLQHEKEDLYRFEVFGDSKYQNDSPRVFNVWNFTGCDPRLGQQHPGQIPGQIIMNLLYYYTNQGDLVVDPMAGGGSTIDACLVMGRRCLGYDISPARNDITRWNLSEGFPEETKGCDFIMLDPPYWNLMQGLYKEKGPAEGIDEENIAEPTLEKWLEFMQFVASESYKNLKEGGYVAILLEAMVDERGDKEFRDLPLICSKFFDEVGFKEVHRISAPVSTEVKSARDIEFAKQNKIILDVNRDLTVYRR